MKIVCVSNVTSDPILHSKIFLFHPARLLAVLGGHRKVAPIHFLAESRKDFPVLGSLFFSQMWSYLLGLLLGLLFRWLPFFLSSWDRGLLS